MGDVGPTSACGGGAQREGGEAVGGARHDVAKARPRERHGRHGRGTEEATARGEVMAARRM